ncbi:MAG: polysaccharide deacetylase family protein [Candidatus Omnitrophica bacterium]|nr:polysaccharide deacetylase family protein [Candidatus Omnitrophota bacterium]
MKKVKVFILLIVIIFGSFWIYLNQNYATPILMYHSVDKSRVDTYSAVSSTTFHKQMKFIKDHGYRVISLFDYCSLLKEGKNMPRNLVVITFDDGYKDNFKAVEILKEFGYPMTIFLIVGEIGRNSFLQSERIMSFLENEEMKVDIGSHTLTHAYLPDQDRLRMKKEIFESKKMLEDNFSKNIETISYPIGGFNREVLKDVSEAGYLCACATNRGFSRKLNRFALRRIKVTNRDLGFKLWAKLSGFYNAFRKPKSPH